MTFRISVACLWGTCLAAYTCGGGGEPMQLSSLTEDAPITAPWAQMQLPLGDGAVLLSDESTCSFTYIDGDRSAIALEYIAFLERDGWKQAARDEAHGAVAVKFRRGGKRLDLTIVEVLGVVTVTLSESGGTGS